jgi:hypothetical protein
MAAAQSVHSKREVTTSSLQALNLINDELVFQWSKALAGRVLDEAGPSDKARLDRLYSILYARKPDRFERNAALAFLDQQERLLRGKLAESGQQQIDQPIMLKASLSTRPEPETSIAKATRAAAFVDLAHTLLNANEFVYRN